MRSPFPSSSLPIEHQRLTGRHNIRGAVNVVEHLLAENLPRRLKGRLARLNGSSHLGGTEAVRGGWRRYKGVVGGKTTGGTGATGPDHSRLRRDFVHLPRLHLDAFLDLRVDLPVVVVEVVCLPASLVERLPVVLLGVVVPP